MAASQSEKRPTQRSRKSPPRPKKATPTRKAKLVKALPDDAPKRRVQNPEYRSFRLAKRIRSSGPKIPSVFTITREAFRLLRSRWPLFLGILSIYTVLVVLLVKGLSFGFDISGIKDEINAVAGGSFSRIITGFVLIGALAGSSASEAASSLASTYQAMLIIIVSLVIIWALRQTQAGTRVGVRESYYKAMYPLVPFLLVLMIIGLQLVPVVIANFLFGVVVVGGIAVFAIEKILWAILIFLLILWSIYMLIASVFALYIVTLPDMYPWQAVRSARQIVEHRRWTVMRKVLFLPLLTTVVSIVIMLPVVMFLTPVAEYVFFALGILWVLFAHSYMYVMYRKLL